MANYDIHFQLVAKEKQIGGKFFSFGFKSAIGVAGPQKLINRWLKTFLTPKGSDPYDLSIGTNFYNLIGSNISTFQDIKDALALAVEDCNDQIRKSDRRRLAVDNERLQTATLAK
jgi:hypothetical protein